MSDSRSIYVITNLAMNHNPESPYPHRRLPIDSRLQDPKKQYTLYLTDENPVKQELFFNETIHERSLDPILHKAGKEHLAEWSFLLAESKHAFCKYPFFMVSSRFYMKNSWLFRDLNEEWDSLFAYFNLYSYGFLPSYSRPMRWVDFNLLIQNPRVFFPFTEKFSQLVENLYQTAIPKDYSRFPDLGCHYLGFKNRQALLDYVGFYKPLLDSFFDPSFNLKKNILDYVVKSGHYPNEKPLTFFFETLSHLYFFKKQIPFFCLHYDGYYEVDFLKNKFKVLLRFPIPFWTRLKRKVLFRIWWLKSEGASKFGLSPLFKGISWIKKHMSLSAM